MAQGTGGAQVNTGQNQSPGQNQGQNGQQQQQQQQQQIQLQQNTNTTAMHGPQQSQQQQQHHHTAQANNQAMQTQLQVIQQSLPGQYHIPQLYNTANGQLVMNGNILHHPGLNPGGIQVITAPGKFQQNQLGGQQMLSTSYQTIPTTQANNQSYFLTSTGQLIPQGGLIQQHGQAGKPGEMPKVIQPQILSNQQAQQLWTSPQFLAPNQIFIQRAGQQDQPMFIHQPMHNNTSTHQQFSMQQITAAGQLQAANIAASQAGMQAAGQQQQQNGMQQTNGGQQVQTQLQQSIQPQSGGNVTIAKAPAQLQPKPQQIQPQPNNQQQQQQQQQQQAISAAQQQQQQNLQQQHQQQQVQNQLGQLQQVAMAHGGHQLQIIPQPPTSQTGILGQSIMTSHGQQITLQQGPGGIGNPRLTLVPQQQQHNLQPQVSVVQHQIPTSGSQPQAIRPNFTILTQGTPNIPTAQQTQTNATSSPNPPASATPQHTQQKGSKAKKGAAKNSTAQSPNAGNQSGNKTVFPRPQLPTISPMPTQISNGTLTLLQYSQAKPATILPSQPGGNLQKQGQPTGLSVSAANAQPLKTINLAALQSPPNLPDATLTPLNPNSISITSSSQPTQPVLVYPANTTLPSPNISITPAPAPPQVNQIQGQVTTTPSKKDESEPMSVDAKGDTEKENNGKMNTDDNDDTLSKQNKLPKAMVKPQVLTHVIEGFVIQEASEPFPMPKNGELDEPPKKKVALSIPAGDMAKCEMCGKIDLKSKFKKNKRFCSSACVKGMKNATSQSQQQQNQQTQQVQANQHPQINGVQQDGQKQKRSRKWGDGDPELTDETNSSVGEAANNEDHADDDTKVNPAKWSVSEVVDFVKNLPGCSEYAEDFLVQEIDGQALLLLKAEHLMSAIGMKLGPALKLCNQIEHIRATNAGTPAEGAK